MSGHSHSQSERGHWREDGKEEERREREGKRGEAERREGKRKLSEGMEGKDLLLRERLEGRKRTSKERKGR